MELTSEFRYQNNMAQLSAGWKFSFSHVSPSSIRPIKFYNFFAAKLLNAKNRAKRDERKSLKSLSLSFAAFLAFPPSSDEWNLIKKFL